MQNIINSTKEKVIAFDGVWKTYDVGQAASLRNVSLSVDRGEFVCLIGPSGCGKSTILKIIAGLEKESTGVVTIPGNVSMVFQSGALFPWFNVLKNVELGLEMQGVHGERLHKEAMKQIELIGLTEHINKYPRELSGGQRQRVGIARALAVDPSVLLLDEPFAALDPKTTFELHNDILKIWFETGKTIVMVSHLIEEAVSLAGRVILMKDSTIDHVFPINIPRPRREQMKDYADTVEKIRKEFFK
ncbi:MAG: ABC transporter ATP-binding protein [Candidatus Vogelbacteria bacterium]|nr:ABC transporter ATP-binding protein [Candidatus Vogelbacteria bacterium]